MMSIGCFASLYSDYEASYCEKFEKKARALQCIL
jgi:hypothetical protein